MRRFSPAAAIVAALCGLAIFLLTRGDHHAASTGTVVVIGRPTPTIARPRAIRLPARPPGVPANVPPAPAAPQVVVVPPPAPVARPSPPARHEPTKAHKSPFV
jgi:hypothetical protein